MAAASRLPRLDALRCVAVILVVGRHAYDAPADTWPPAARFFALWKQGGWIGVDLFFVLSGFLVSGLLFREQRQYGVLRVPHFLIRRGFKIYPAFYVYVVLAALATLILHRPLPASHVLAEALFAQNYFQGIWWTHTWSLAVEEHFYILLSVLLFYLTVRARRREGGAEEKSSAPFRSVPLIFAVVAAACLGLRIAHALYFPGPRDHYLTHLRIDSLLFGVVLSYLHDAHHDALRRVVQRYAPWMVGAGIAAAAHTLFVSIDGLWMKTGGFTVLYLGFGALVIATVYRDAERPVEPGWFAKIGVYSYSIYLWHRAAIDAAHLIAARVGAPFAVEMMLAVAASVVGGVVMAKIIEIPVLRVRDRLFPSRSRPLSA